MAQTETAPERGKGAVKLPAEERLLLEQMARAHCRSMSGEASWLIRQAHQQLQQQAGE
jgi:hypothetical protein